jgi:hypothetical protein
VYQAGPAVQGPGFALNLSPVRFFLKKHRKKPRAASRFSLALLKSARQTPSGTGTASKTDRKTGESHAH